MLPLNTIEKEMKQVCTDYMKGEDKMKEYPVLEDYIASLAKQQKPIRVKTSRTKIWVSICRKCNILYEQRKRTNCCKHNWILQSLKSPHKKKEE